MTLLSIPLARYEFRFKVTTPFARPDYAGSMLRGIFGHALKKITCIYPSADCKDCTMYQTCTYPEIFETPPKAHKIQAFSQIPNPYIIEPPPLGKHDYLAGEYLIFNMVLTGKALKQFSLVILAMQQAFKTGVSRQNGSADLDEVYLLDSENNKQLIFSCRNETIQAHEQQLLITLPNTNISQAQLHFKTPLRIQQNSKPVRAKQLSARQLLVSLARRINLLNDFHNDQILIQDFKALVAQAETVTIEHGLKWHDWIRYSNRQQQKMRLGGLIGEVALFGDLTEFYPLLYLGQWLHLGKNATFGLGGYELTVN